MQRDPMAKERARVLSYLKNRKRTTPENFRNLFIYGVHATELLKLLETPERYVKCVLYAWKLYRIITKIDKHYIVEFPKLPDPDLLDRILLHILLNRGEIVLGRSPYFQWDVKLRHVLAYLQRKKEIYTWNSHFVIQVMGMVKKARTELVGEDERFMHLAA